MVNQNTAPLLSQAVDVHRSLADKVLQQFKKLGQAGGIGATVHSLVFRLDHAGATYWANLWHFKLGLLSRAPVEHRSHHMGNNVASPFDYDPIPDADILSVDVVGVMQRCLPNSGAADHYRLQDCIGIEATGTAHVDANVQQPGHGLFRRELEGDGPPGLAPRHTHGILKGKGRHFDYHAVYLVWEFVTPFHPGEIVIMDLFQRVAELVVGVDAETQRPHPFHRIPVIIRPGVTTHVAQGVNPDLHVAGGRYLGVQLPYAARSRIPGIGVQWLALFRPAFVQAPKLV